MPQQVNQTDKIIFPDGVAFEVSNDAGLTWYNLGVLENGAGATYNYDKVEVETGNAGKLDSRVKNETLALAPSSLLEWDPLIWEKFSGGAFAYETIAGTLVPGDLQDIAADAVGYLQFITIENQNADGSIIVINSVTGATDGVLTEGTDYIIVRDAKGAYGIQLISGGNITTLSQVFTIDYDNTPAAGTLITGGESSFVLSKFMVRIRHYTDDALTVFDQELLVYSADMDAGLAFAFKGANEDGVNSITVAFTAVPDISRATKDQLFKMTINQAAYNN